MKLFKNRKTYYLYNPNTLDYERVYPSAKDRLFSVLRHLSTGIAFGIATFFIMMHVIDSPQESQLRKENKLNTAMSAADTSRNTYCILFFCHARLLNLSENMGISATSSHENTITPAMTASGGMLVRRKSCALVMSELQNRALAGVGRLEIYVSTPLEECERRDVKGLYAKARRGEIKNFTGISAPFEAPVHPALTLDTSLLSLEESVNRLLELVLPRIQKK